MSDDPVLWAFLSDEDIESGQANKKPFFSVIIPAHNAADYIAKGLNSIARQTFTDFELIVVCDRCTDETFSIAQEYADLIGVVDYGLDGLTRNRGIDLARGRWLLFMDDDDWWMRGDAFQLIHDACVAAQDTDMVFFDFLWQGRGIAHQTPQDMAIAVWCKAWRRSFVGDTRFPDTPYWSDVGFHKAMMAKHPRAAFLGECLYHYNYLRPGSISWRAEQGEIE